MGTRQACYFGGHLIAIEPRTEPLTDHSNRSPANYMLENLHSHTFVALFRHLRHARNDLCEPDCHFNKISLAGTNTYANSPSTATANSPICGWQHPNAECERIIQANDELFAVFWFENQNKYSIKSLNTFGKFPGWASMTARGTALAGSGWWKTLHSSSAHNKCYSK